MIRINIKFLVFIIIIAIFAYSSGGNLPYTVFYAGILVLLGGLIHITIQRITMKINLNIADKFFRTGDVLSLNIIVKSFSALPAGYIVVKNGAIPDFEKNFKGDIAFLNYHEEKNFSNELKIKIRGIYDFSVTNVLFTDLFCIMTVKKTFVQSKLIKVYPRIHRINEKNFNGKNILKNSFRNTKISEDSNEIRDLRLYREGDSLKRVHWKLSAKHNELYVKNFVEVASKDTNIILNMNKGKGIQENYDLVEEQMMELAVSLINYLQTKKFKIKLFINNEKDQIFTIENQNEFELLMEYLVNNKSQGNVNLVNFLNSKANILKPGTWLGIVTIEVDEALVEAVKTIVKTGFKISIFYYNDNHLDVIKEQNVKGLEFIEYKKAIFSLNE